MDNEQFEVLATDLPASSDPHNHALVRNVFTEGEE
jgi:hypothetical protein